MVANVAVLKNRAILRKNLYSLIFFYRGDFLR
jgi:hypothetical protein